MRLSAFLDELIQIEAARVAALHELRARLTAENEPDKGDIPFEIEPQPEGKQGAIDTVMGAHLERPTSPARQQAFNHYRCKCSEPAKRIPPTGYKEKNGKLWAAFACPKGKDDPRRCDYWEFDPNAPKAEKVPEPTMWRENEPEPDWARS